MITSLSSRSLRVFHSGSEADNLRHGQGVEVVEASAFWIFSDLFSSVIISLATYYILLYHIILYCIVLYCIVLYCIVLYCIVLYCIVYYCILLYTLYYITSHCIKLYYIVLYYMCYHLTDLNSVCSCSQPRLTRSWRQRWATADMRPSP